MRTGETPTESAEDDPVPPRRPYWIIGLVLLGLVIVVFVGAFMLNARLRPLVGIETATVALTESPTPAATVVRSLTAESTAVSTPSGLDTPAADLNTRQAVAQAYLRYWDVYNDALYTLNTARLGEVMSGAELSRVQMQIGDLRSQDHAVKSDVQHKYVVVSLSPGKAGVQDQFLDKSYLVDLATKRSLQSPGDGKTESIACQLQIIDGAWKVVSVVRVQQ